MAADAIERIATLEVHLSVVIDKLDTLITTVTENQRSYNELLTGNATQGGLMSRLISLEDSRRTTRWAIGVIYVAAISAAVRIAVGG